MATAAPDQHQAEEDATSCATRFEHLDISKEKRTASTQCVNDVLPIELLLYIFAFLSRFDLCNISSVCKLWLSLVHDPSLWLSYNILPDTKQKTNKVEHFLEGKSLLKKLSIEMGRGDCNCILYIASLNCPNLKNLSVKLSLVYELVLQKFSNRCSKVESLDLEGTTLAGPECTLHISRFSHLKSLNLRFCRSVVREDLVNIAKNCSQLSELNIESIEANDFVITEILKYRKDTLQKLHLYGQFVSRKALLNIAGCQNLELLGIDSAVGVDDSCLQAMCQLKRLKWLKISAACRVSRAGLRNAFSSNKWSQLRYLDLPLIPCINDRVLKVIAKSCPFLVFLGLLDTGHSISDIGIVHILQRCRYLKYLDLRALNIDGNCLAHIPFRLPYLQIINLSFCPNLRKEIVNEVLKMMPGLIVMSSERFGSWKVLNDEDNLFYRRFQNMLWECVEPDFPTRV